MQKETNKRILAPEQSQKGCCCGSTSDKQKANADKSSKQYLHIEKTDAKVKGVSAKKSRGCCGGH